MDIRQFYARSIPAALRDIRRTLGPDAVILETRQLREGAPVLGNRGERAKVLVIAMPPQPDQAPPPRDRLETPAPRMGGHPEPASEGLEQLRRRMRQAREARPDPTAPHIPAGEEAAPVEPPPTDKHTRQKSGDERLVEKDPAAGPQRLGNPLLRRRRPKDSPPARPPAPTPKNAGDSSRFPMRPAAAPPAPAKARPRSDERIRSFLDDLKGLRAEIHRTLEDSQDPAPPPVIDSRLPAPYREAARSQWQPGPPTAPAPAPAADPPSALALQGRLREQGVEEALVQRLTARVLYHRQDAPPAGEERAELVRAIEDFLPAGEAPDRAPPGPRVLALVGPTGVGKTTTLAKIASLHALERGEKVVLISLDCYRVAAAEQLKTYARLLGVALEVLPEPERLAACVESHAEADLILVDTPGQSPRDRELFEGIAAALRQTPGIETQLVLNATLRAGEMRRLMEQYRPTGYRRLLFSKLDETDVWGDLLNTWIMGGFDVSYFTTGQRVPEDLEKASVETLCRTLLAESLALQAG